jgi:hypothetical protein
MPTKRSYQGICYTCIPLHTTANTRHHFTKTTRNKENYLFSRTNLIDCTLSKPTIFVTKCYVSIYIYMYIYTRIYLYIVFSDYVYILFRKKNLSTRTV